jgi:hypothetical protein
MNEIILNKFLLKSTLFKKEKKFELHFSFSWALCLPVRFYVNQKIVIMNVRFSNHENLSK